MLGISAIFNGSVTLTEEYRKLDSLFGFYSSEITAHSNYLVGLSFAFAVFFYTRLINLIGKYDALGWFDILFLFLIISFGIWLYGRLVYYLELSGIAQNYMSLSRVGVKNFETFQNLMKKEQEKKNGLANIITDSLVNRIRYCLLRQVDDDFRHMVDVCPINERRACLITFSNSVYRKEYWNILKEFINS